MKNWSKGLFLSVFIFISASISQATTFTSQSTYFVKFHFSAVAFGKEVASVYAHAGVLIKKSPLRGGEFSWQNIKHVSMARNGDHFFAKEIFNGSSSDKVQEDWGVIVQYWVLFTDGTQLITDSVMVSKNSTKYVPGEQYEKICEMEQEQFDQISDTDKTAAVVIIGTWLG